MSEKKKIVIQCKEELDKNSLNEINKELKENLNDGAINTISPNEKMMMQIISSMDINYKKENDRRSMMGEKLQVKDVKIWTLENDLTDIDISRIKEQANKKLEKYTDRKTCGFFSKLKEQLYNDTIMQFDINEINDKLHPRYTNVVITKERKLIDSGKSLFVKTGETKNTLASRIFYNKNVIICLVEDNEIKFFVVFSVLTYTRNGLEKYNKRTKKSFEYREI